MSIRIKFIKQHHVNGRDYYPAGAFTPEGKPLDLPWVEFEDVEQALQLCQDGFAVPLDEPAAPDPTYMTLDELEDKAGQLGISQDRIETALKGKEIKDAKKQSGEWRIPWASGIDWLETQSNMHDTSGGTN